MNETEEIFKILPQNKTYKLGNKGTLINMKTGHVKSWHNDKNGYFRTTISIGGAETLLRRGLGILTLFGPPKPEGDYTCDHINNDTSDDRLENLRWANKRQQALNKKYDNGLPDYIFRNSQFPCEKKQEYVFQITLNKKRFRKQFYTLGEALAFRDNFLQENEITLL